MRCSKQYKYEYKYNLEYKDEHSINNTNQSNIDIDGTVDNIENIYECFIYCQRSSPYSDLLVPR